MHSSFRLVGEYSVLHYSSRLRPIGKQEESFFADRRFRLL